VPEQLLDRVLREIRERRNESRAAYEESQLLQAALAALDRGSGADTAAGRTVPRGARQTRRKSGARAPRGENLRRIRETIEQRPGSTAGEVAAATGIGRPTVASTLGKLARGGELEKTGLPGGGVGFQPTRGEARIVIADATAAPRRGASNVGRRVHPAEPRTPTESDIT